MLKKNPFAISFIHSPSIHLDAGFIPGTTLGYRETISSIFQNLKKKTWMCWSGGKEQSKQAFATDGNQKKKKMELSLKRERSDETLEFYFKF